MCFYSQKSDIIEKKTTTLNRTIFFSIFNWKDVSCLYPVTRNPWWSIYISSSSYRPVRRKLISLPLLHLFLISYLNRSRSHQKEFDLFIYWELNGFVCIFFCDSILLISSSYHANESLTVVQKWKWCDESHTRIAALINWWYKINT